MIDFFKKIFRKNKIKKLEKFLFKFYRSGEIGEIEYEFILKILKARKKTLEDIMIPRIDVVFLKENMTLKEAIEAFKKEGFSKMPVLDEKKEEVLGILHIKEILKNIENLDLKVKEIMQEVHFFPEYKNVLDTLSYMQKNRISIGVVVDEFGNSIGIVTMEDLLEEIVGEIHDEFDKPETLYKKISENTYIFNSKITLEEVEKILDFKIEEEEVVSLGGFIISFLKRVPQKGEKFTYKNLEFEIVDSTPQRIKFVKIKKT